MQYKACLQSLSKSSSGILTTQPAFHRPQDAPADGSARGLSADGVYESGSLRAVWSLCTNEEVRLPEGLREFTCFAIFLLKVRQVL